MLTKSQVLMLDGLIEALETGKRGVYIHSRPGLGKTFFLSWLAQMVSSTEVCTINMPRDALRVGRFGGDPDALDAVESRWQHVIRNHYKALILVDEVGRETNSAFGDLILNRVFESPSQSTLVLAGNREPGDLPYDEHMDWRMDQLTVVGIGDGFNPLHEPEAVKCSAVSDVKVQTRLDKFAALLVSRVERPGSILSRHFDGEDWSSDSWK